MKLEQQFVDYCCVLHVQFRANADVSMIAKLLLELSARVWEFAGLLCVLYLGLGGKLQVTLVLALHKIMKSTDSTVYIFTWVTYLYILYTHTITQDLYILLCFYQAPKVTYSLVKHN